MDYHQDKRRRHCQRCANPDEQAHGLMGAGVPTDSGLLDPVRGLRMAIRRAVAWVLLMALAGPASAQRIPIAMDDSNFTAEGLIQGVAATAAQCAKLPGAVWSRTAVGEAECIRYWAAGMPAAGPVARVLVYIPGDQMGLTQVDPGYAKRNPGLMQEWADGMQATAGVPFILLSRPGIFGSSGEHRQRRRDAEARLMSAALDEIKARHGIRELVLVGLSGGGHVVAALLGWRSDIVCAVPTSSVSSPRLRWETLGKNQDSTGYADSYEPVDHLRREILHPQLRVFVLGDPRDSLVPWLSQMPLAESLRKLGVPVELLTGEGSDPMRHVLAGSGRLVGSMCLRDRPTQEILELAARGLKG